MGEEEYEEFKVQQKVRDIQNNALNEIKYKYDYLS